MPFNLQMSSLDTMITGDGFCLIILFFSHCQDCYILDQRGSSVMVWKGKQASKEERREALNRAVVSLINNSYKLYNYSLLWFFFARVTKFNSQKLAKS